MAKDLIIGGGNAQMPEHLRKMYEGRESNVMDVSIAPPSLAITGKVWTVKIGSESIVMRTKDADDNVINVQTLPLVILDYAKNRGRAYYEGSYTPDNTSPPDCFSNDGILPDASIGEPQHDRCQGCPMSIKGSRVTDNNISVTACAEHRILAVIPAKKLDGSVPPLRLKLAQTSDYDGRNKDAQADGWFAFSNFLGFLKARGIEIIDAIVVKATFDAGAAYPKLLFKADSWLDETQAAQVKVLRERPEIATILGDTAQMPAGGRALPPPRAPAGETAPASTRKPRLPKKTDPVPAPEPEPPKNDTAAALADVGDVADQTTAPADEEEDEDDKAIREAQERKKAKAAAAAAAKKTEPKKDKAKPDTAPTSAPEVSKDAAALLGEWD